MTEAHVSKWKLRREALNLTQTQIAKMVGVPRGAYAHFETGRRDLGAKFVESLENVISALESPPKKKPVAKTKAPAKPAPSKAKKPKKPKAKKRPKWVDLAVEGLTERAPQFLQALGALGSKAKQQTPQYRPGQIIKTPQGDMVVVQTPQGLALAPRGLVKPKAVSIEMSIVDAIADGVAMVRDAERKKILAGLGRALSL